MLWGLFTDHNGTWLIKVVLLLVLVWAFHEPAVVLLWLRHRRVRQHILRLVSLCSCDWIIKIQLHVIALLGSRHWFKSWAWSCCLILRKSCIMRWFRLLITLWTCLTKHEILVIELAFSSHLLIKVLGLSKIWVDGMWLSGWLELLSALSCKGYSGSTVKRLDVMCDVHLSHLRIFFLLCTIGNDKAFLSV